MAQETKRCYQQKIYPGDIYILKDLEYNKKHQDDLSSINTIRYQRPCIIIRVNPNRTYGVIPLTTKDNEIHTVYPMQIESHVMTFALLSNYMTVDEIQLGQFFSCLKPEVLDDLTQSYSRYLTGGNLSLYRTQPMKYNELDCISLENWKYYKIENEYYLAIRLVNRNQILIKVNGFDIRKEQSLDFSSIKLVTSKLIRGINPICVGFEFNESRRRMIYSYLNSIYKIDILTKNINPFDCEVFKLLTTLGIDLDTMHESIPRYIKKFTAIVQKERQEAIDGKFYGYIYSTEHLSRDHDIHIIIPYLLYHVNIFTCNLRVLVYMIKKHPFIVDRLIKPYRRCFYLNSKSNKLFDGEKIFFGYRIKNMHILHKYLTFRNQGGWIR